MAIDKDYGDIRDAVGNGLTVNPVRTMMNHATTELFFDQLRVPVANLFRETRLYQVAPGQSGV